MLNLGIGQNKYMILRSEWHKERGERKKGENKMESIARLLNEHILLLYHWTQQIYAKI